jgi:hypothetical protein
MKNRKCSLPRRKLAPEDRALHRSMLSRLRRGADVRMPKVARVRDALREREYMNLLKLHVAADRLAAELQRDIQASSM